MSTPPIDGEVQRLADAGQGRNAIARELGVTRRNVDDAADRLGITWDRSRTIKATQARLADTQAELSEVLSDVAAEASRRLRQEIAKAEPDHHLIRSLSFAAGMGADRVAHLADRVGTAVGPDNGEGAIERFSAAVEKQYKIMQAEGSLPDSNIK